MAEPNEHPTRPPSISVLISTYDDRRHVAKKLAEIERQTIFDDVEFIFIETDSPGRERDLIMPFCTAHANCSLIAIDRREPLFAAWNRGWRAASADWLCYTNMDDSMHPCLLETLCAYVRTRDCDICTVLTGKQAEDDLSLDMWSAERLARLRVSTRPGPFTAWRRSLAEEFGTFEERFITAGDKDFWSRAIHRKLRVGFVPKLLYLYTTGANQLSKQGVPAVDVELMASRPYPMKWPWRLRTLTRLCALGLKVAPSRFLVSEPPDV